MHDVFTGDLLFVEARREGKWAKLRAELDAWWTGSRFNDVAVAVRDPSDTTRLGAVLMEHGEPRLVPMDAWLGAAERVVVRRTTTRALPYYASARVEAALVGVELHCDDVSTCGRGLGFLQRWFAATGAAALEREATPRALSSDTDATRWAETGLYEPDALLKGDREPTPNAST